MFCYILCSYVSAIYPFFFFFLEIITFYFFFPGMIAVCGTETELLETSSRLTEANMSALSALRAIEQTPKQSRDSLESVIRKTEC